MIDYEETVFEERTLGSSLYITFSFEDDGFFMADKHLVDDEMMEVTDHDEREEWITIKPEDKDKLLMSLLKERFHDGNKSFNNLVDYLEEHKIPYVGGSWG